MVGKPGEEPDAGGNGEATHLCYGAVPFDFEKQKPSHSLHPLRRWREVKALRCAASLLGGAVADEPGARLHGLPRGSVQW